MSRKTHTIKIIYFIGGSGGTPSEIPDCLGEGMLWQEMGSCYSEGTLGFEESSFSYKKCPGCPNCPN